jgi:predicted transglutaminase-like cysteine proteinase
MQLLSRLAGLAGLVLALTVASSTSGSAANRQTASRAMPTRATFISVGHAALTPYGWADFCQRYAGECHPGRREARDAQLDPETWSAIRRVNLLVNSMVKPMSDLDHYSVVDRWDLPTDGYGDCEDYVLLKRKLLLEEGLPRSSLLVTVVKDENGDGHAILTVKTDKGEFILDNMRDAIHAWDEVPYRFVKRQSQEDEDTWVQIGEPTVAPLIVSR